MPLVARSKFCEQMLPIVMLSHAFKGLYYQEVKSTGLVHQKASFNSFYLNFIAPAVNSGKIAARTVSKVLMQSPYSFGFCAYLAADYSKRI